MACHRQGKTCSCWGWCFDNTCKTWWASLLVLSPPQVGMSNHYYCTWKCSLFPLHKPIISLSFFRERITSTAPLVGAVVALAGTGSSHSAASHTCTVLSQLPEAMRLPSGDHATAYTPDTALECPR